MPLNVTGPPRVSVNALTLELERSSSTAQRANVMLHLFLLARDGNVKAFEFLNTLTVSENDHLARGYTSVLLTSDKVSTISQDLERAEALMKSVVEWLVVQQEQWEERDDLDDRDADNLHRHILFLLGFCYSEGYGVEKCLENAVDLLTLSANRSHSAAQNSLALACFKGLGTAKDYRKGAFYYQQSADQFNTIGQYNSGVCHVFGTGVVQNDDEALRRFRQAAMKGHVMAKKAAKDLMGRKEQAWLEERYNRIYAKNKSPPG